MSIAVFKPLTNRSAADAAKPFALPQDGFVMLTPKGEAPNLNAAGKRIIQVVDDEALKLIYAGLINRGGEMLVDDEHHSHDQDKVTDANAWQELGGDTLQIREDGLWGHPRWSTKGLANVEGGVKRYVSPEFPESSLVHLGGNRYRVTEMSGLALTNRPGFRKLQKPLTNREDDPSPQEEPNNIMHKKALALALGITEAALDALDENTLCNRARDINANAAKSATLEADLATLRNREVDSFMETHKDVIPDDLKETLKGMVLTNRAGADAIVNRFKGGDGLTEDQRRRADKRPLFNRETAAAPAGDAVHKQREERRAAVICNRANEIARNERIPYGQAWSRAEAENPAES